MYILIFIIMVLISMLSYYLGFKIFENDEYEQFSFPAFIVSIIFTVLSIVAGICCYIFLEDLCEIPIIEQKIIVYQDENKKIEEEIHTIVENYKDYESEVFSKNTSVSTLVNLYPELKSDSLVKQQIDIYQKNNEQIKKLKISLLEAKKAKFMLYFGNIK